MSAAPVLLASPDAAPVMVIVSVQATMADGKKRVTEKLMSSARNEDVTSFVTQLREEFNMMSKSYELVDVVQTPFGGKPGNRCSLLRVMKQGCPMNKVCRDRDEITIVLSDTKHVYSHTRITDLKTPIQTKKKQKLNNGEGHDMVPLFEIEAVSPATPLVKSEKKKRKKRVTKEEYERKQAEKAAAKQADITKVTEQVQSDTTTVVSEEKNSHADMDTESDTVISEQAVIPASTKKKKKKKTPPTSATEDEVDDTTTTTKVVGETPNKKRKKENKIIPAIAIKDTHDVSAIDISTKEAKAQATKDEKEAKKAEKEAKKAAKIAEKEAEKEAKKAAKIAEKEAEKEAKKAAKIAEKEAEKEAKKAAKIAEKEAEKEAKVEHDNDKSEHISVTGSPSKIKYTCSYIFGRNCKTANKGDRCSVRVTTEDGRCYKHKIKQKHEHETPTEEKTEKKEKKVVPKVAPQVIDDDEPIMNSEQSSSNSSASDSDDVIEPIIIKDVPANAFMKNASKNSVLGAVVGSKKGNAIIADLMNESKQTVTSSEGSSSDSSSEEESNLPSFSKKAATKKKAAPSTRPKNATKSALEKFKRKK